MSLNKWASQSEKRRKNKDGNTQLKQLVNNGMHSNQPYRLKVLAEKHLSADKANQVPLVKLPSHADTDQANIYKYH